jgi:hypothetical protein
MTQEEFDELQRDLYQAQNKLWKDYIFSAEKGTQNGQSELNH